MQVVLHTEVVPTRTTFRSSEQERPFKVRIVILSIAENVHP